VFPKSDAQRARLADSVKNILLFRALDKEQMTEVLDAMFEKVVSDGDYIIRQGDDGDNFYVIEKYVQLHLYSHLTNESEVESPVFESVRL